MLLVLLAAAISLADRAIILTDASAVRVWARRHDPWANPHAQRHFVSTSRAFGNRTHFTSYRGVTATAAQLDGMAPTICVTCPVDSPCD
eukprot:SAG31_NODE_2200_length_6208_cov_2.781306_5_plen_89_part_00